MTARTARTCARSSAAAWASSGVASVGGAFESFSYLPRRSRPRNSLRPRRMAVRCSHPPAEALWAEGVRQSFQSASAARSSAREGSPVTRAAARAAWAYSARKNVSKSKGVSRDSVASSGRLVSIERAPTISQHRPPEICDKLSKIEVETGLRRPASCLNIALAARNSHPMRSSVISVENRNERWPR